MKQVMIPQQLFLDLVIHHVLDRPGYEERIRQGLSDKMDAILRREWFTQYCTAPDEASREEARRKYLEAAGIPTDFRW